MAFPNSETMGEPLSAHAGRYLLETIVASNDATVEFTTGIDDTYDRYEIEMISVIPATDSVNLHLKTSSDGGSTFDSGASDYAYVVRYTYEFSGGDVNTATSSSSSLINYLSGNANVGNASGESLHVRLNINDPSNSSTKTIMEYVATKVGAAGTHLYDHNVGTIVRKEDAIVDAIQFYFSSGNISSGTFKLYGIK